MGRPLKKSFFGSPATDGKQLVLTYVWLDSDGVEEGYYIVRQVGTGRYQVTNGTKTGVVKLVDALPDGPGQGVVTVYPFGSTHESASKIHNRTVKTFDGNSYKWSTVAAAEAGEADLPFEAAGWSDPEEAIEDVSVTFTAGTGEGAVGYAFESMGSIGNNGNFNEFDIYAIFDTTNAVVILSGELETIEAIEITVGGTTVSLDNVGYADGLTRFENVTPFGLSSGNNYDITHLVDATV